MLGSRDRVMIIRGVAGTGKTTLEQEIGEALAEAGQAGGCPGPVGEGQPGSAAGGSGLRQRRYGGQVPEGQGDAGIGAEAASSWSMRPASSARGTCSRCSTWPKQSTLA